MLIGFNVNILLFFNVVGVLLFNFVLPMVFPGCGHAVFGFGARSGIFSIHLGDRLIFFFLCFRMQLGKLIMLVEVGD